MENKTTPVSHSNVSYSFQVINRQAFLSIHSFSGYLLSASYAPMMGGSAVNNRL